tara:strand:- start:82 stop:3231 length:3150 start_codon:yes stop_codon:yes gene_type:complete
MKNSNLLFTLILSFFIFNLSAQKKGNQILQTPLFDNIPVRNIGPAKVSGRITKVIKDYSNTSTWYVTTASGNVWKTVNSGTTWKPIFEHYGSYSIGTITMDPVNPNVLWLGTGENNSQRSVGFGDGIYKSIDAGNTWTHMGLKTSEHIAKIIIDPKDSDNIYVASQGPLWRSGGQRGLYNTKDGGKTWQRILHVTDDTGISDVVMDHNDNDIMYASTYQRRRHFGILVAGGPQGGIFKSLDRGKTWKKLENGLPGGDLGRIGLAISPQKSNVVYALITAKEKTKGFYRSDDYGETWKKMSDYQVVDSQYYVEIFPDPHQFDKVYSVDMRSYVTVDGGKTFERIPENKKHVDSHDVLFDPNDPDYIMISCDGGIYESFDRMKTWRFIDNLPIIQLYRVGIDNQKPFYNVYGGTQDNDSFGGPSRTKNRSGIRNSDWFVTTGGDGFQVRVDPTNPNILYTMSQYAGIMRYDKSNGEKIGIQPQPEKGEAALRWNWDAPLIISPHKSDRLYFAANFLFQSDDKGDSWVKISPDLTRNEDRNKMKVMGKVWSVDAIFKNVFTSPLGTIVALDESKLQQGLLVVGTDDGLVRISRDNGKTWDKYQNFPGVPQKAYVTDIVTSKHDVNTIYVSFNYHKYGDFKPYVVMTKDGGRTWKSISSNIPENNFVWTLVEDHINPNILFVGTEFGMYFSMDAGSSWRKFKKVPTIPIRDLEIHEGEDDLVAASFGRGFYIVDDYSPIREYSRQIEGKPTHLFSVKSTYQYIVAAPEKTATGHNFFTSPNPPYGVKLSYYLGNSVLSKFEERQNEESKKFNRGETIDYPSAEKLEDEAKEKSPKIYLTISDSEGKVVRRISTNKNRGYHEKYWDLRTYSQRNIDDENNYSGPLVPPGKYSVHIEKFENDKLEKLTDAYSFDIIQIGSKSSQEDREKLYDFQLNFDELVTLVNELVNELDQAIEEIDGEINKSLNSSSDSNLESLNRKKGDLMDLKMILTGTRSLNYADVFSGSPPSVQRRLGNMSWELYNTTSKPTKTHEMTYKISKEKYDEVLRSFREIMD